MLGHERTSTKLVPPNFPLDVLSPAPRYLLSTCCFQTAACYHLEFRRLRHALVFAADNVTREIG